MLVAILLLVISIVAYALRLDALPVAAYWPKRVILLIVIAFGTAGFLAMARSWPLPVTRRAFDPMLHSAAARWLPMWLALAAFGCAAIIATATLHAVPMSGDESTYVTQADMFAQGRVSTDLLPAPVRPYFAQHYIFPIGDKLISQYPPGWSAVLAAASWLGIPYVLVNPLVGALTVLALWHFAARQSGREVALLATLLMIASAFYQVNSASFYNGSIVALFGVLAVGAAVSFLDAPTTRAAVATGLWFSALAVTRHFDAVLFALPVAFVMLRRGTVRHWRLVPAVIAAGLPLLLALFVYYWWATGKLGAIPQTLRDPNDGLFGAKWHITRVTPISIKRVIELAEWVSVPFVAALAWALVQRLRERRLTIYDFYGPLFLAGYWLEWSDSGYRWGPRYIYPALPFMALTVADQALRTLRTGRTAAMAHLAALSVLVSLTQLPTLAMRAGELVDESQDIKAEVRRGDIHNAVVVLTAGPGEMWAMGPEDLARNGLSLNNDVIYAHGPRMEGEPMTADELQTTVHAMHEFFPARQVWLYERLPGVLPGKLVKD